MDIKKVKLSNQQWERIKAMAEALIDEISGLECGEERKEAPYPPENIVFYIMRMAKKAGWKGERMARFLDTLESLDPMAAFSMLLKEVAIALDERYGDHIKKSEEVWAISSIRPEIVKLNKEDIASYKGFAAFRTEKDARYALKILSRQYGRIFGGE